MAVVGGGGFTARPGDPFREAHEQVTFDRSIGIADPAIEFPPADALTMDCREFHMGGDGRYAVDLHYQGRSTHLTFHSDVTSGPLHYVSPQQRAPSLYSVMQAVLADAALIENTAGFPGWADAAGEPVEDRGDGGLRAIGRYRRAVRQTESLRTLLGADYEEFLWGGDQAWVAHQGPLPENASPALRRRGEIPGLSEQGSLTQISRRDQRARAWTPERAGSGLGR